MTAPRWLLIALGVLVAVGLLFAVVFPWVDRTMAPDPVMGSSSGALGFVAPWLDGLAAGATD